MTLPSPETAQKEVAQFARSTQAIINIIFAALPLAFAYLKLNSEEFRSVAQSLASATGPKVVWELAIVIYFASWIYGAKFDTTNQEIVYLIVPNRGKLPLHYAGILFMIGILFGVLAWMSTFRQFAVALCLFWCFNIASWHFFARSVLAGTFSQSSERYRQLNDYFGLEKLLNIQRYIAGEWQWWRFGVGSVLVAAMLILSFTDTPNYLARTFGLGALSAYAPAAAIFVFVGVVESWMWFMRIKTGVSQMILDELSHRYKLAPGR